MSAKFTPREIQVMELVARAMSRKDIAGNLKISVKTVDSHLNKIHLKTGTATTPELIVYMVKENKDKTT